MSSSTKMGGPLPKFNDYHLWKALEILDNKEAIGRKKLAEALGIGEGSARTVISLLQEQGLITIGKSGILLTGKGMEFRKKTHMDIAKDIGVSMQIKCSRRIQNGGCSRAGRIDRRSACFMRHGRNFVL